MLDIEKPLTHSFTSVIIIGPNHSVVKGSGQVFSSSFHLSAYCMTGLLTLGV